MKIEVDLLLEKYSEISKRSHQLDLERINLEVELELNTNETEQTEISRQLKRVEILQDRFQEKRHQTRDELFDLSQHYHERHEEGEHEAEAKHSKTYEIESERAYPGARKT